MDRREILGLTGMAIVGAAGLPLRAGAADMERHGMSFDHKAIEGLAESYTAAWNTGTPQRVAEHFAPDGEIVINRGTPWRGRPAIADMAAGFFSDVPDMKLSCDGVRRAGAHVVYLWTFTGHAARTANALAVHGWEEWDVGADLKVQASRGWYDAADYALQVAGGRA